MLFGVIICGRKLSSLLQGENLVEVSGSRIWTKILLYLTSNVNSDQSLHPEKALIDIEQSDQALVLKEACEQGSAFRDFGVCAVYEANSSRTHWLVGMPLWL